MAQDPFLAAQADLLSLLDLSRPLLSSYLRIRTSASSANSPELNEARQDLQENLRDLGADLQDLVDSIRAVENDPSRYGLDSQEISRRKKLVSDVRHEVENMHKHLDDTIQAADQKHTLPHPDSFLADEDPLTGPDGDEYRAWEEERQMEMMHEQDGALEDVFKTVGNLRLQADTMGRELEEQAELLEETENITDRVGGKLAVGMQKMRLVIEKSEDKWSNCCIAMLIFVLILLLILILVL